MILLFPVTADNIDFFTTNELREHFPYLWEMADRAAGVECMLLEEQGERVTMTYHQQVAEDIFADACRSAVGLPIDGAFVGGWA